MGNLSGLLGISLRGSAPCCPFFLYPSALCWKYPEVILKTAGNGTFSLICWDRGPFSPFIWGKDEHLPFCFVFPHPFLLPGRNSFLEASTSGRGVVLRPLLLYSVLLQNPAQRPAERSSDSVQGEMTQGRPLGPSEGQLETLKSLNPELML